MVRLLALLVPRGDCVDTVTIPPPLWRITRLTDRRENRTPSATIPAPVLGERNSVVIHSSYLNNPMQLTHLITLIKFGKDFENIVGL